MRSKSTVLIMSFMLLTGCFSTGRHAESAEPDWQDYSLGSLTLSGDVIGFPVTDQSSARSSIGVISSTLGITNINRELGECKEYDTHGIHTYRFNRKHDGIPIFGTSVVVCAGSDGEVLQISGRSIDFNGVSSDPKLSVEEIISKLKTESSVDKGALIFNDGMSYFVNDQNQPVLCYRLISADTEWYECLASADTGEILFQAIPETETVICNGEDMQGKQREFPAEYENGTYYLKDYKRSIYMFDAGGETFKPSWAIIDSDNHIYIIEKLDSSGIPIKGIDENKNEVQFAFKDYKYTIYDTAGHEIGHDAKTDLIFERLNAFGKPKGSIEPAVSNEKTWDNRPAVTLYTGLHTAYDFCKEVLNINSYDNQNGFIYGVYNDKMKGKDFLSRDPKNAYSVTLVQGSNIALRDYNVSLLAFGINNSIAIDVIGHELGHSINAVLADFEYKKESGAIKEGIADVFGELIEDWDDDNERKGANDWIHNNGRNLRKPEESNNPAEYQGENWKNVPLNNDNGGVHNNSTVISHAAYLMSIGSKKENCKELNNTDIAILFYHTLQDNDFPTNVGMIEFSEKMIDTARMLASQSVLDWDKVKTVIQSLAEVNLSESGSSYSSLKPDFKVEVLDPNGTLYDNYHVEIISCNGRLAAFAPAFYLTEDNDTWSLYDEFDVTTHEMPSVHLPDGYYIIRLTDNQSKKIIHKFSVNVSEADGIKDKLQTITALLSLDQPVSIDAEYSPVETNKIPPGLEEFLATFAVAFDRTLAYLPGNSSRAYEYDAINEHETWILPFVLDMTDFSKYSITKKNDGIISWIDEADVDWVLTNIYNLSEEALEELKHDPAYSEIYHDGRYELRFGAGAPGVGISDINAAFNGKYYYVSYNMSLIYIGSSEPEIKDQKQYALLEYKIIDGKEYWSIYKNSIDSNAIDAPGIN